MQRIWIKGKSSAFQADNMGSNPVIRSLFFSSLDDVMGSRWGEVMKCRVWRSLVACLFWEQKVVGSNPATLKIKLLIIPTLY